MTIRADLASPKRAPRPRHSFDGSGPVDARAIGQPLRVVDAAAVAPSIGVWRAHIGGGAPKGACSPSSMGCPGFEPSSSLRARVLEAHVDLRASFRSLTTAESPGRNPIAAAHAVDAPSSAMLATPRGYCEAPSTPRRRETIEAEMATRAAAVADLCAMFRFVAADEMVRAHCPHVASANDEVASVGAAVVVDVLLLCPDVLDAPELEAFVDDAAARTAGSDDHGNPERPAGIFDALTSLFGPGLACLGGLLSDPLVVNVLAPLLVQGLNLVVPGLGVALAPVLPIALPLVGQLLQNGGALPPDAAFGAAIDAFVGVDG
jgi:hypothetical protein